MYPRTYYETFMRYEASDDVFVAMPFSGRFQTAYAEVIEPAIKAARGDSEKPLQAKIINIGTSGAPDIHEQMFDAIIHSRLVIADMTVQASHAEDGKELRWQPNANVAYEVGLASAWRNPEEILLIYQENSEHSYSFDVQNLRHVPYKPADPAISVPQLAKEIKGALAQSAFLAGRSYEKLLQSASPSVVQYMNSESECPFPRIYFPSKEMPPVDCRVLAATELLACGALKYQYSQPQGGDKGVMVCYRWTELGLRMLVSRHAIGQERKKRMADTIASVPDGEMPPPELLGVQG